MQHRSTQEAMLDSFEKQEYYSHKANKDQPNHALSPVCQTDRHRFEAVANLRR